MSILKNLTISDTGFVQMPSGTTAQRGGSGETVLNFTTVGSTTWTCPAGVTSIRLLIVAGGGGGGGDVGGGGGGGGVIYYANYAVTPSTVYNLTVGGAGSGGTNQGTQGGNSVFNGVTAYGGGYGGYWSGGVGQGGSTVGSAGGGTSNITTQALSTSGQGNHGGRPGGNTANSYEYSGASGGGGAGSVGGAGIYYDPDRGFEGLQAPTGGLFGWTAGSTLWGYGGDGLSFDISGTPTFYAGGGGACSDGNSYWGVGGKGGGGRGGPTTTNNASYYGGGGGGAGSPNTGGNGYQGVVIIAYNAQPGDLRYNTTNALPESLAGNWEPLVSAISASGGSSVTTSGGYTIRTFTTSGSFTMNTPGTVEVLLVAGGGGGGTIGGGGGGGGYLYQSQVKLNGGVYPVVVGQGGSGATSHSNNTQSSGTPSQFHTLEAIGGGMGCSYTSTYAYPGFGNGGSGGGGPGGHWDVGNGGVHGNPSNTRGLAVVGYGGSGVQGQGHPGGSGTHGHGWYNGFGQSNGLIYSGGGGGGAGSTGGSVRDTDSLCTGGNGMMSTINGNQTYYGGGGGAGVHQPGGLSHYGMANVPGGAGGGGAGGGPGVNGGTGGTNTGGGGGGGHHSGPNVAGPGGPGVVIIRHL